MNILLVGEKYSSNLGDGVIFQIIKKFIKSNINCNLIDFDLSCKDRITNKDIRFNHVSLIKKQLVYYRSLIVKQCLCGKKNAMSDSTFINMTSFKARFENIVNSYNIDVIIFAGGQLLNYTFIDRISYIIEFSKKKKMAVLFNACGFGNYIDNYLLKNIISLFENDIVKFVSVRDGKDLRKNLPDFIRFTHDSALICSKQIQIQKKSNEMLGIGIMLSKNQSVYTQYKFWKKVLLGFKRDNVKFRVFTNGDPYDKAFVKFLLKNTRIISNSETVFFPESTTELINCICGCDRIVSMRLHSLIIAYSYGIPAIAIAWDKKVREFYQKIGNERYCVDYSATVVQIKELIEKVAMDKTFYNLYNIALNDSIDNLNHLLKSVKDLGQE